jgi:CheY-like chemotaxis protein
MIDNQPRVLLADDEDTFRLSTSALLEHEGYRCDSAGDIDEAARLLSDSHDVLISDIRMPGNTQFEFLRSAREQFPDLPIVVVTGYPSVQSAVDALRLSFVDYLLKPIEWPELLEAVTHAVKKVRLVRERQKIVSEVASLSDALDKFTNTAAPEGRGTNLDGLAWSMNQYLATATLRMSTLAAQVTRTLADVQTGQPKGANDVCRFMQCPRLDVYERALRETIDVLERTKHAFKSKDLGELRRKLELLLKIDLQ